MPKGSAFTRVIEYFRTADLTEAQSCLQAATAIVQGREVPGAQAKRSYTRKPRTTSVSPNGEATGATA